MTHSYVRLGLSVFTLGCAFWGASCSSKSDDEATHGSSTGGVDGDGGSSGTGASDGSGGTSEMGGEGGGAGAPAGGRDSGGPPEAPGCVDHPVIQSGQNYGNTADTYDYSVFAVRLLEDVPEGTYSIRVHDDDEGEAFLYLDEVLVDSFEYDPEASLADAMTQTVSFPGYFELDLRSQTQDDLSALSASLFDGCHYVVVSAALLVEEGGTYGPYTIQTLVIDGDAEPGTYTFYAETGNGGSVEVFQDGESFATLEYDWMTTVGGGESFTFVFDGLAEITVTRAMGTSNLFGLADGLFDGRHELRIE